MRLTNGSAMAFALAFACLASVSAQESGQPAPLIGAHDIGGTVRSPNGPEAGVWVIGETRDLSTRFAKMVVTDYAGRFVIPDLPAARYQVDPRLWSCRLVEGWQ